MGGGEAPEARTAAPFLFSFVSFVVKTGIHLLSATGSTEARSRPLRPGVGW